MAYFKNDRNDRFKKPSFNRGNDRRDMRDDGAPKQLFQAECSNCHAGCEVPFRPDGVKPVFCRNCFSKGMGREPGARDTRPPRREFSPRPSYGAPARESFAPRAQSAAPAAPDRRIDGLARSISAIEQKLDRLTALVESTRTAAPKAAKITSAAKPAKAPAKKAVTKTKKK